MKEDYLWDKTGTDPEIEMLETALRAFRYQETAPPTLALPAKVVPFKKEPFYKGFRFAVAMAACLAFGVLAFGVWFQILRNNLNEGRETAGIQLGQSETESPNDNSSADATPGRRPDASSLEGAQITRPSSARKVTRNHKTIPAAAAAPLRVTKARPTKEARPEIQLTKEERYAYNQLMLALSITSSKLKLVKDKVEGLDEKTSVFKHGQ